MNTVALLHPSSTRRRKPRLRTALLRHRTPGQGLVEYAMLLLLIAIVVVGSVTLLGVKTSTLYQRIHCGFARTEVVCQGLPGNSGNVPATSSN